MYERVRTYIDKLGRLTRLKPLSLADKCRLQFGVAVVLSLLLALLIPYLWMGKLTEKIALDAGRAVADSMFERHLQIDGAGGKGLPMLEESGVVRSPENRAAMWIRFDGSDKAN